MAGGLRLFGLDPRLLVLLQFVEVLSSPRLRERSPPLAHLACGPFRALPRGRVSAAVSGSAFAARSLAPPGVRVLQLQDHRARLSPIRVGSGRGKPAPRTPEAGRWMCSSSRGEDVGWAFPPGPGRAGLGEALVDDTHLHAVILVCATAWPRHLLGCGPR